MNDDNETIRHAVSSPRGLDWARFSETDWFAYAGAERLPDGSAPLVAYGKVDEHFAVFFLCGDGLSVIIDVNDDECQDGGEELRLAPLTPELTWKALLIREVTTTVGLKALFSAALHETSAKRDNRRGARCAPVSVRGKEAALMSCSHQKPQQRGHDD